MGKGSGFGKTILFGEHFVVYGLPALASAIGDYTEAFVEVKEGKGYELTDERPEVPGYKEKKFDEQKVSIQNVLNYMGIDIEKLKKYVIDRELMRKVLGEFGSLYDKLETDRKINLIRLLVREIEYFKDRVKIKLRDLTESGEKMSLLLSEPVRFAQYQLLLPG